ncbi:MAG TPA: diguanylate cyclase [Candidatus Sulfotelmatobacter sp.]|jgi:diguanylate cyclase (GGDEF)-like protein|nr:diguanylate cyclase [Candidatus Sulfotelmatobacter sp.]
MAFKAPTVAANATWHEIKGKSLMAADVSKQLERAKKFLEKNRVEDAIEAYLAVLDGAPQHLEASQALGDLYTRLEQPDRAAVYYGHLFDLLIDPKDETKALAIYNRFLRNTLAIQSPERITRYAFLLQKQNRGEEAIEQYTKAAEMFSEAGRGEDALFCWERTAQLDPEKLARQMKVAEIAAQLGKNALAARAFLRSAQLSSASGAPGDALKLLARAYALAPQERSVALLYAEARLRNGDHAEAAGLLEPFASTESDVAFLDTFADALLQSGQLDRSRAILEKLLREKNEGVTRLFDLADAYADNDQDSKSVEILQILKRRLSADKKLTEFSTQLEALGAKHPESIPILEFWAAHYSELNRESQYFEVLIRLFDANFNSGFFPKACEALDRLVDIDSYDYRCQERLERLRGHADEAFLRRVAGRMARTASAQSRNTTPPKAQASQELEGPPPATDEGRKMQALDDLIVQTEIFLQYSLQAKAIERLQKIASMFPGEEARNPRLQNLYQVANWWPKTAVKPQPPPKPAGGGPVIEEKPTPPTGRTGSYTVETLRDLTKISEINQKIFRQQTPRAMLNTTVNEVGAYMKAARTFSVIGAPGRPPEMAAEHCTSGLRPAPAAQMVFLLAQIEKAVPDELGGLIVDGSDETILKDLGLATALGVTITDKETQAPAGMLIVAHDKAHHWKPNETYFLQAIGDQMMMSVSHTRLRSLVRRMGVSDEKTGLLSRSSYVGCLLNEADRARTQGTPLSLAVLQIDRGADMLRAQGEVPLEKFLEQLSRSLQPIVRQNDMAVKYTSWALAFILPDTNLSGAQNLVDKLKRAAAGVRPPWDSTQITLSAGVVEAAARQEFDSEDIVTDLINRAEFSVEEARKRGGDVIVLSEIPKL